MFIILVIENNFDNIGDKAIILIYLYRENIEQNIIVLIHTNFRLFYLFIFSQIFILIKF